jgi:hypothetical protein
MDQGGRARMACVCVWGGRVRGLFRCRSRRAPPPVPCRQCAAVLEDPHSGPVLALALAAVPPAALRSRRRRGPTEGDADGGAGDEEVLLVGSKGVVTAWRTRWGDERGIGEGRGGRERDVRGKRGGCPAHPRIPGPGPGPAAPAPQSRPPSFLVPITTHFLSCPYHNALPFLSLSQPSCPHLARACLARSLCRPLLAAACLPGPPSSKHATPWRPSS